MPVHVCRIHVARRRAPQSASLSASPSASRSALPSASPSALPSASPSATPSASPRERVADMVAERVAECVAERVAELAALLLLVLPQRRELKRRGRRRREGYGGWGRGDQTGFRRVAFGRRASRRLCYAMLPMLCYAMRRRPSRTLPPAGLCYAMLPAAARSG